jgi:hypothetical protein
MKHDVTCPHCGYEYENSNLLFNEEDVPQEFECEKCEQSFFATQRVVIVYEMGK